jgi:hypothetical protein
MRGRAGLSDLVQQGPRRLNRPQDFSQHRAFVGLDHPVGKPQNPKVLTPKPSIPPLVVFGVFRMERSVGLDNQSMAEADEVNDVPTNRSLTTELETRDLPTAKN